MAKSARFGSRLLNTCCRVVVTDDGLLRVSGGVGMEKA